MDIDENIESLISSLSLHSSGSQRDFRVQEVVDIVNEKSRQLERVESLTAKLQAESKANKDRWLQLEKERLSLRKELTKLRDDDASVGKKLQKLKSEIRDATFKIKDESQKSCINEKEKEIMHQNTVELDAYKNLTGIRWNFDVPETVIEGHISVEFPAEVITNSQTKFVKAIELEKTAPSKKIRETLWNYIKEAGSINWDQLEDNKENQQ